MKDDKNICPHCDEPLTTREASPFSDWSNDLFYCENDDCSYFVDGRKKVCVEYEKNYSYRYCYNPENGKSFPLITWCGGGLSLLKGRCGTVNKTEQDLHSCS